MVLKSLTYRYLLTVFFLTYSLSLAAQTGCKEIMAKVEVVKVDGKSVVKIDFNGQGASQLLVSVVGPKGYSKMDITETEIKGLAKGGYTLVINGRKEGDYCIKHFQFTID
jgi:hypothetical protein